jgi:hypothetical protein
MALWRNKRRGFFIPKYDELSLFMMSVAFLLVFFTNSGLRNGLSKLLVELEDRIHAAMLIILFTGGLILSLYHVFIKRQKKIAEKFAMLIFAIVANGVSGILASVHILNQSVDTPCIFIILPLWNIMNCIVLLILLRFGVINPDSISDEDVQPFEALLGFIIILTIFALCQYKFKLYWAITFSICVIYATSFSDALASVFHRGAQSVSAEDIPVAAKGGKPETCGLCGRMITPAETPYVIKKKLIVCKDCYDSIQKTDS